MGSRTDLQTLLETTLGSTNVYFQPPPTLQIKYPCIIYERSYVKSRIADNIIYSLHKRYTITVIDKNPDSSIPDKIAALPTAAFDRHLVIDNLYHDVFNIYY